MTRNSGQNARRAWERTLLYKEEDWFTLIAYAIFVGIACGFVASGLRSAVHAIFSSLAILRASDIGFLLPAVGAGIGVVIVLKLFKEPQGHGVPEVIRAVLIGGGRMRARSIFSRWLGSMCSVALGCSAGLEGPIVHSGAAVGSTLVSRFIKDERRRSILAACGVAGGIAAIFNAPMTGMMFALEVVLTQWSAVSVVLVVICAATSSAVGRMLLGDTHHFYRAAFHLGPWDLILCAGLGLVAGLVSVVLVRMVNSVHKFSDKSPFSPVITAILGGLCVGVGGVFVPEVLSEGYQVVNAIIYGTLENSGWVILGLLAAKMVASAVTLGTSAPGGVFAPCLVCGSLLGGVYWRALHVLLPATSTLSQMGSYGLAGMAGLISGVMQAPLTGILLVMEVTSGYEVILPLMVVSVIAFVISRMFERHSIYTAELAARGELLRPGSDARIMTEMCIDEVPTAYVPPVHAGSVLADVQPLEDAAISMYRPVIDQGSGRLCGMLKLYRLQTLWRDLDAARVTLVDTVAEQVPVLRTGSRLMDALDLWEDVHQPVLPVVDGADRYVGLLSKGVLFELYRRELAAQTSII